MTRTFAEPRPLRVRTDAAGQPRVVVWRGRPEPVHVCNLWRSEQDWWAGRPPRTFYQLLTRSRAILVVFHDATGWYVEQVLD